MKSKFARRFLFSVLFTVLVILNAAPAFAAEDAIPSIKIDAVLQEDSSADITEIWSVRGVSDGTEYYKALDNMDDMGVHSLRVTDESGTQYKTLDSWDTDRTREEKAGTCGILKTADGYELCWGIGSYGDHQYTIRYVLDGLVKDYGDYAGFYHQFVSELSSAPESVSVTVRMADTSLTEDNARIWGYGYPGNVNIEGNGTLSAISSEPFDGGNTVNLLCRFDRNLFPQAAKANRSFDDLQKSAENANSNTGLYVFLGVLAAAVAAAGGLIAFFFGRYRLADGTVVRLARREKIELSSTVPFGAGIPATYAAMKLLRKGVPCNQLMGAYLVRWQRAGYVSMEEREERKKSGKTKMEEVIVFHRENQPEHGVERALYDILLLGVDPEGILWSSDIEKRAEKLYETLLKWASEVEKAGEAELIRSGMAAKDRKGAVRFTASGFDQAVRMVGFQKYLLQMKAQNADGAVSRALWGDYLVFAVLFGLGEQVLKIMKAIDPAYFETFSGMYGYNSYHMMYFITMTNNISNTAVPNTGGTGGAADSVGGGGFSGGGGGGSR